ncbi:hypothetical protein J6590_062959 [Homalodisca vitripennis]|nr:hypothetical protein J6590_062959 [Homalodisca vitripennis]
MRHALPKLRRKDKLKYLQYVYPEQHTSNNPKDIGTTRTTRLFQFGIALEASQQKHIFYKTSRRAKFEEKVCEDTRLASCRRVRQRHPRLTLALTDIADTSCEIETLRETWTTMEYVPLGKTETSSEEEYGSWPCSDDGRALRLRERGRKGVFR